MQIVLNGNPAETAAPTVRALLDEQGVDAEARGVAVAVNETVVPRRHWIETRLGAGDAVEIVKPFRGG